MYGFEFLYNLGMGAKIVLILGTCIIIGLVLQMKNSKQDTDKVGSTTLNADNSSKYNVFTEKQAVKNSGTSLASNGKTINSDEVGGKMKIEWGRAVLIP